MASNKKISQLINYSAPKQEDLLAAVDKSVTPNETKNLKVKDLLNHHQIEAEAGTGSMSYIDEWYFTDWSDPDEWPYISEQGDQTITTGNNQTKIKAEAILQGYISTSGSTDQILVKLAIQEDGEEEITQSSITLRVAARTTYFIPYYITNAFTGLKVNTTYNIFLQCRINTQTTGGYIGFTTFVAIALA